MPAITEIRIAEPVNRLVFSAMDTKETERD